MDRNISNAFDRIYEFFYENGCDLDTLIEAFDATYKADESFKKFVTPFANLQDELFNKKDKATAFMLWLSFKNEAKND